MIKKTWIIPHEAFEIFGCMFSDGVDVLKLYLHRLSARIAKVSGLHFGEKNLFTMEESCKEKNIFFNSRHLRGSN